MKSDSIVNNNFCSIRRIIFLGVISVLFSCNETNKKIISKWENGKLKMEIIYKNKPDSTFTKIEYFENGNVKSTQDFVNGKLNGKLINYSEKGFKQQEFDYVNGKEDGIGTAWYESGKIAFQFKFKNGLAYDGTEYFEDGWPRVLMKFSAPGITNGKVLYFKEDGSIWQQGYFKDGKEDSVWTKFDKKGNVISKTFYIEGKEIENKN